MPQTRSNPVDIVRRPLFESETIRLGLFGARPTTDACGEVEIQTMNALVLPLSGVFSKHDSPSRAVIGTPSHVVLVAADTPYRLSYPGAIGDRALTLRFDDALAPEQVDVFGRETPASHGLLSADAMLLRNLLCARLAHGGPDPFAVEALALDLLSASLQALRGRRPGRSGAEARRTRAIERVKEAVALAPAEKWTIARLADIASLSPFHLCRVFRDMVGTSVYEYVLRQRLASALDAVCEGGADLTAIALDFGFASHSHFTARFRGFFGCAPTALRRVAGGAGHIADLRKIMTAPRSPLGIQ